MATFRYRAYAQDDPSRVLDEETIEAASRDEAARTLMANGFVPMEIVEVGGARGLSLNMDIELLQRIKPQELAFFTRQLATLINANINVVQALDMVVRGTANKKLKAAAADVKNDINQGLSFTAALRKHPDVFDSLYVSLVQAGETGELPEALLRLADMLEDDAQLRREVRGAMVYPAGVLTFSALIFVAMMLFVVPAFQGIFESTGGQLPAPTRVLVFISDTMKKLWFLVPVVPVGAMFAFRRWVATVGGRQTWDALKLKLPKLNGLLMKIITARFFRTLATLQSTGVPLLQALEIAAPTAGNVIVRDAVLDAARELQNGRPLASSLRRAHLFEDVAMSMLDAGEKAGEAETMMNKVAETYEQQVSNTIKSLKSIMEPAMMVGIGIFIGAVVISLYLPLFSVYDQIQK